MTAVNTRGIMNRHLFTALALALATASGATAGSIVYDNTTTDTFGTIFYSTGPYQQIGDMVTLGGTGRNLTGATVQFFNNGGAGSFDAVLRFWNPSAPVGSQIGSEYQVTGLAIDSGVTQNVSFSLTNLLVPVNLIATVQILNASTGTDLGLDLFDPPTVGSSDNTQLIVNDGTRFSTSSEAAGSGNLYLQLTADVGTTTPEPSTAIMFGGGLILAAFLKASRRKARTPPLS